MAPLEVDMTRQSLKERSLLAVMAGLATITWLLALILAPAAA
jgi:hypothetical protein